MELSEASNFFTSSLLPNIPPDIRAEILPDKTLIDMMMAADMNLPATVGTQRNSTLTSLTDAEKKTLIWWVTELN